MHRRSFLGSLSALGLASAAPDKRTQFYVIEHYKLKSGSQPARLHDFFSQAQLPALNRIYPGPKLYLDALVAPDLPHITAIYGFSSLEEMGSVYAKMNQDEAVLKSGDALESGNDPAFQSFDSALIEATDYSPEIKPEANTPPRIFELRVYHSPTRRQLVALHERFRGPEIKIFHRSGIHPILYGSTVIGANQLNLVYLIPFTDLAAREKAWAAFGADPDWQKVRKESIEKSGEIVSGIQVTFFKATAYSPVR